MRSIFKIGRRNMYTLEERALELHSQGFCCSQQLVYLAGLDLLQEENEGLICAMMGLGYGMHAQGVCGSLTGGACALGLHLQGRNLSEACRELTEWFKLEFGGLSCSDLLGLNNSPSLVCREAVLETAKKCLELLMERDCLAY